MTSAWRSNPRFRRATRRAAILAAVAALAIGAAPATAVAQTSTLTAAWDANTDGYTLGYRLYYGTSPNTYSADLNVGNVTSYPLTLAPGTYYFTVRAYNASNQLGPAAAEVAVTVAAPPPPPPVDCVLSAWSFQSATSWSTCTGGQQSRTETWTRTVLVPPANGGAACGPLQEQRTVTQACTMPAPGATLAATLVGTNTASLTWSTADATAATLNGASVALSGTAQFTISAATTYTLVATGPGGSVTRTATIAPAPVDCVLSAWSFQSATPWGTCAGGQQSRTETWTRTVIVQPANGGAACGPLQEDRTVTQTCTAALTPPEPPLNLSAKVSGQQVTLSWSPNPNGGAPNGYLISVGTWPGGSNVASAMSVGNTLSATSDKLGRGAYYARVKAANGVGISADSAEVSFKIGEKGKPRQPGALSGSLDGGVLTLSWTEPVAYDGDGGPTGYLLEAGSEGGLSNLAVVQLGNITRFQVGAVPDGVYYLRIRGVNDEGAGDPSNEIMLSPTPTIGAPQALTESGDGAMVSLDWRAPGAGGRPAGYVIEAGSSPGLADLAVLRLGDTNRFTTTAPPGVYYVRVRAVDDRGRAGEASNEIVVRR